MHISITKALLVNFVFNNVTNEEREKIIEAINTNPEVKERYLYEKRIHDIERYIYNGMNIGESCEIEELIKMDSRLSDHFALHTKSSKEEQDLTINHKPIPITDEQLIHFVLNAVNKEERKKIIEAINTNPEIKERYLYEKRKCDVEKYLDDKMDFGERCEMEDLLKRNLKLHAYFELKKDINKEGQNISINPMHTFITKEQLIHFVLNGVNEKEHKKIIEAINTKPEIKERYLFEKRKLDIERYIDDEMNIGESCEIEELIKMDSRLYDYFESNTEAIEEETNEEEQGVSISDEHLLIIKKQLVNFILTSDNEEYIGQYEKISKVINSSLVIKDIYLNEKRKHDVEGYLDDKMDFGERCEFEELLKRNLRLYKYFDLKKDLIEEQENILINLMYNSVTRKQLVNFVLNDVNDEERKKIIEAINTKPEIKERYLFEKRKNDVERYLDDEMTIGECCEIEELLKMDSRLLDYFKLNNGVIEEEQTVSINIKHIAITKKQLIHFVLNDVTEKEHKKISEAINTNSEIRERYLFEKRKHDVERFIDGEVDFGEACEIEELLKTDSRLFEYFELNKDVNVSVLTNFIKQINDAHARVYNAIHNNEPGIDDELSSKETALVIKLKPSILKIGKWVAAASIIFMIGFGSRNFYLNNTGSFENRLYTKYYEPLNSGAHYDDNSMLIEAKRLYSNKEYDLALMILDEYPNFLTLESEYTLYQGLTLMELKRYDEAIEKLKQLQNNNITSIIQSTNNWYLGLCYLKAGKNKQAIAQLEKITNEKVIFYKDAKELLEEIKK